MKYLMLLLLLLIDSQLISDDFVPKDVAKAYAIGCVVAGDAGPPPFVETQVFVKLLKENPNWDFHPKMSRRDITQGGVHKAIYDCIDWLKAVDNQIEQASKIEKGASK